MAEVAELPGTGVLTYHRCINYGSFWQAKCLVDGLRNLGVNARILDHRSRRVDLAEWKSALRPTLPTQNAPGDSARYRVKVEKFQEAFLDLPLSPPFCLDDPGNFTVIDQVVVGSDEVWNLSHPWYGGNPLFFGQGIQTDRWVSYGASFGQYGAGWGLTSPWKEWLAAFDQISVRDQNSRWIIEGNLGRKVELVLDPCLQFEVKATGEWQGPNVPFVAVYGHNFSTAFAENVRLWANRHGVPVISIGYRNDWADEQWIEAGPHDFAQFMARANCVATNFFHGCVFALRHNKPFVCETTPYRLHKIEGLMELLGSQHHLAIGSQAAAGHVALCLEQVPDTRIEARLAELSRLSLVYLQNALV